MVHYSLYPVLPPVKSCAKKLSIECVCTFRYNSISNLSYYFLIKKGFTVISRITALLFFMLTILCANDVSANRKAELKAINGVLRLFIDGKPRAPLIFFTVTPLNVQVVMSGQQAGMWFSLTADCLWFTQQRMEQSLSTFRRT